LRKNVIEDVDLTNSLYIYIREVVGSNRKRMQDIVSRHLYFSISAPGQLWGSNSASTLSILSK
jgi:hypothetical protein